jgi:hypothetical protein
MLGGALLLLLLGVMQAQQLPGPLPFVDVFTLDGERISARSLTSDGMPMILVFFKTYDRTCLENLVEICEAYTDQLKQKGVKMMAICIDCVGKSEHVKPFVFGRDLDIDVYVDTNGDLKRSMGIPNGPYTILYDEQMKVLCKYSGYCSGAGDQVCRKMNECLGKMASAH